MTNYSWKDKLAWLEKILCKEFQVYLIDSKCAYAPTGESFITYCSAGIKPETKTAQYYNCEEEAIDEFEKIIRDIIKTKRGILYWRKRPEIVKDPEANLFFVYSRFLISNKPINIDIMKKYYNERIEKEKIRLENIYESTIGW